MSVDMSAKGGRVHLAAGRAEILPAAKIPEGLAAGRFSVLSPGTERRHLTATVSGPPRQAGYMALAEDPARSDGWMLAPVPHGAAFDPRHPSVLTTPQGTPLAVAALARFQQIAMLGLDRLPAATDLDDALVIGSGPVALGCVLELHRRGALSVRVLTSRSAAPIRDAPGVECVADIGPIGGSLVIDAVGSLRRAARLLAQGATLGLLGTPQSDDTLCSLAMHRGGWTVVGMHELAVLAPGRYQAAYSAAATWLTATLNPLLMSTWCRHVHGTHAPRIYELLGGPRRPIEPIIVFEWAP
jgi:threonine dehydrogenase-like Zn-dependent dehydrogenase